MSLVAVITIIDIAVCLVAVGVWKFFTSMVFSSAMGTRVCVCVCCVVCDNDDELYFFLFV